MIVLYGAGPIPSAPGDPVWPAIGRCQLCGSGIPGDGLCFACWNKLQDAKPQHPRVELQLPEEGRADVRAGIAALLPILKAQLREIAENGGTSLTKDEVLALVWLEGVAAGHDSR